jgi:flagellar hook-length control protein FliK
MAPVTAELMSVTGMRLEISGVTDEAAPAGAASAQLDQHPAEQDVADLLAFAQTIGSQAQIRPVSLQAGPLEAEPADAREAAPIEEQPIASTANVEADESSVETKPFILLAAEALVPTPAAPGAQPAKAPPDVEAQLAPEVLRGQQPGSKTARQGMLGGRGSAPVTDALPVGPVQPNTKQMPSGTQATAEMAAPSMTQDAEVTTPHPPRDLAHSFRPLGLSSLVGQVPTSEQATASHTPRDGGHSFRPFDLASLVGPASTAEQAAAPVPLRSFDTVMPQVLAALAPAFEPAAAMQSAAPLPAEILAEHQLDLASDGAWLDQLARDIAGAGEEGAPLRFRLNPEMLGSLRVEIRQEQAGAAVRLTAETEAARAIIADAQPRLVAEARAQGVRITETHVDLGGGQGSGDSRRQQSASPDPQLRTARLLQEDALTDGKPTSADLYA